MRFLGSVLFAVSLFAGSAAMSGDQLSVFLDLPPGCELERSDSPPYTHGCQVRSGKALISIDAFFRARMSPSDMVVEDENRFRRDPKAFLLADLKAYSARTRQNYARVEPPVSFEAFQLRAKHVPQGFDYCMRENIGDAIEMARVTSRHDRASIRCLGYEPGKDELRVVRVTYSETHSRGKRPLWGFAKRADKVLLGIHLK